MSSIAAANLTILIGAAIVVLGIGSSLIAARFGAPLLLVFLGLGMLAGEDGPGGILFSNHRLSYLVGSVALAIILFDGGLRTKMTAMRGIATPAILLATVGVVLTASIVGAIAWLTIYLTQAEPLTPAESLLMGSIVASTDAAAVFFLIRVGGLSLRRRVGSTLELESSANDPMAVFLTVALGTYLTGDHPASWMLVVELVKEGVIGAVLGLAAGFALSLVLNRVAMPQGLHPIMVACGAVLTYGFTAVADGSGLLAVYLAGIVLGNRPTRAYSAILSFHDALTWLCQLVMFVLLGLLVSPHQLFDYALPAAVISAGLMLVARPAAVFLCLMPFRFSVRELTFIAWVGLRGAVSIFLASIPVLMQLPNAQAMFNIGFFVVLISLLVQGWTVALSARLLGVTISRRPGPAMRVELDLPGQLELELVGYRLGPRSALVTGTEVPSWAKLNMVVREDRVLAPHDVGPLQSGDHVYLLAPPGRASELDRLAAAREEV